ncbi:integrator complex subunit 12 [Chelonus insularis]|uniref:integrator complex subunit 12 n=1 Tax=Chelonus insularis TaxID=460826 RepID=UPI00158D2D47|nr:integrator complex subunit 12 [Chelonus insularis]XP_034936216.1 integrator complex subunit 12 [Chelonus insularis]XP_034936217.1 integrator complex subunit 12 [Chelonus insularis]XP_034936218.1 integrator complex subunit 12 [Chelonus insularis]
MTQFELDPQFVQGLRLLHSSNKDSMDQLRTLLDEAIKQKYGLSKMLCNVLHKKYTIEEPVLSDHSSCSSKKSKSSSSSSKHSGKFSKSDSIEEIAPRDTPPDLLQSDDPLAEILEDDLTCVVCKGMDVGARNRLVECADCHALYHQECHSPPIQDSQIDIPKHIWYCSNCIKIYQPPKEKGSPKPSSESKKESKKSTNSKHSDKYKSSSSSEISSSSSAPKIVPNINIIDKRYKDISKKSKSDKRSSSSGKHSSSPSTISSK